MLTLKMLYVFVVSVSRTKIYVVGMQKYIFLLISGTVDSTTKCNTFVQK